MNEFLVVGAWMALVVGFTLIGYSIGRQRYDKGLSVVIEPKYRKRKDGTRRQTGWRWKARKDGRGSGFGTRTFSRPSACYTHVVEILNVNPKNIQVKDS